MFELILLYQLLKNGFFPFSFFFFRNGEKNPVPCFKKLFP